MENIQDFLFLILFTISVAVIGFYLGRWMVFRVKEKRKKNKFTPSNILGDSLAEPMDVYGSAVAPGRSSVAEISPGNLKANSLSFDPGENPADSLKG